MLKLFHILAESQPDAADIEQEYDIQSDDGSVSLHTFRIQSTTW